MKTQKKINPHPPIIDRNRKVIQTWNHTHKEYYTFSFEFVDDLAFIIKQKGNVPGILYKDIEAY